MGALLGWPESIIALVWVVFVAGVGVVTLRRIREDLLHPLVLVGAIIAYYILVPAAWLLGTGGFRVPHRAGGYILLLTALVVCGAAYAVIVVAYRRVSLGGFDADIPTFETARRNDEFTTVLVWLGVAGFVVGLVSYCYYVLVNGGFVRLVTVTPRTAFQTVPNTGRFEVLGEAGVYAGMIVTLVGLRGRIERRTLSRRAWMGVALVCAVALAVAISIRSRMNIAIIGGFLLLYFHGMDRVSERTIAGAAGTLVVFGLGFTFIEGVVATGAVSLGRLVQPFISTIRLEIIMETMQRVPDHYPFQWGGTWLHMLPVVFEWFPRRMGNQLEFIVFGTTRPTYTAPAMYIAALWLNFGLVGVLVGSGIYGAALAAVRQAFAGAQSAVARGLYPFVLLAVLSALPTSVGWAVKSMAIRLGIPIVVAFVVAAVLARRVDVERFAWVD
jgi:oligosaccharide repeat unit polymerase